MKYDISISESQRILLMKVLVNADLDVLSKSELQDLVNLIRTVGISDLKKGSR